MPNWETRFQEHPVFTNLEAFDNAIASAQSIAADVSADAEDDVTRLGIISRRIRKALTESDPYAASYAQLNNANSNLTNATTEVKNFQSNKNLAHLAQANTHAENAVAQTQLLFRVETPSDIGEIQDALGTFRRSLGQHLHLAKSEVDDLEAHAGGVREKLSALQADLAQIKERADSAIAEFQSQFSESEKERRQEAQQALKDVREKEANIVTRYNEAQEQRQKRFDDLVEANRTKLSTELEEMREEWTKAEGKIGKKVADYLTYLEEKKTEVEAVAGAVAASSMSGGFQQVANREKMAMRIWQGATVASIIGFVWIMLSLEIGTGDFEWIRFAQRMTAALGLGGLAAYAGREAAKHAEKERRNRKMQLEIAAIGPFLASIPKTEQDAVKKAVADRALLRPPEPLNIDDDSATPSGLIELVRAVKDLIKTAK